MNKAREEGRIFGVKIAPSAPAISHLLFANNCIIFSKDSKYLGLLTQWERSKNRALRWIEERVSNKLGD
ncbi:hypothetical protein Ahy_B01g056094 [Arachis hypogaea]|uniref:Reverse transcriptase domain-containing protein n=1 Tax=Arachis hypogaea TaxID=3818 RepID=A0A445AY09_ARAHY|nr:hypothetical protein Ahy_B01g056094 [Arachis hypogaea]